MPSDELSALRAKAYGPDGGLSAAELVRLQELEGRSAQEETAEPGSPERPHAHEPASGEPAGVVLPAEESVEESVEASPARRWPALIGAAVVLLALGFGVGWALWGWDGAAFALAAAHGGERSELEASGDYDPGTVVAVAERHGIVVWKATRYDGDEICLILTVADSDDPRGGCSPAEQMQSSTGPGVSTLVPDGYERAGDQFYAALVPTAAGDLVPVIQVWDQSPQSGWESQYSEAELAQVRQLEDAGYQPDMLSIIGYDRDTPVWTTWELGGLCVLVITGGDIPEACSGDAEETITLSLVTESGQTDYVVEQSQMRGPQLTIIRRPRATVDDPNGDEPMFDDLVIDDKTGEAGE